MKTLEELQVEYRKQIKLLIANPSELHEEWSSSRGIFNQIVKTCPTMLRSGYTMPKSPLELEISKDTRIPTCIRDLEELFENADSEGRWNLLQPFLEYRIRQDEIKKYIGLALMKEKLKMRKCPETRILIAKDVLKALKSRHLRATPMTYLSSDALGTWNNPDIFGKQVCELLKQKPCYVCVIGALFVGQVERFNKLKYNGPLYSDDIREELTKAFSMKQLEMIEACFEGWYDDNLKFDGTPFSNKYPDATKRMEAIMRNIIRNKGTFVPKV